MSVLGIKIWSSVRATSTLNHKAISPWKPLILNYLGFRRKSKKQKQSQLQRLKETPFYSELLLIIGSAILNA